MLRKILVLMTVLVCFLIPISVYSQKLQIPVLYSVSDWKQLNQREKELAAISCYTSYWAGVRDSIQMFSATDKEEKNAEIIRQMLIYATPISSKDFVLKINEFIFKADDTEDMLPYIYKAITFYLMKSIEKIPSQNKGVMPIPKGPKIKHIETFS